MTALTQDKNIARREGTRITYPVAASVTIYAGAMVALNSSGHAVPAGHSTADSNIVGIASSRIDTQSKAATATITIERGVFMFDNDSNTTHKVKNSHIGKKVYALDDQTVSSNNNGGTRKIVGKVLTLENDTQSIWVIVG